MCVCMQAWDYMFKNTGHDKVDNDVSLMFTLKTSGIKIKINHPYSTAITIIAIGLALKSVVVLRILIY